MMKYFFSSHAVIVLFLMILSCSGDNSNDNEMADIAALSDAPILSVDASYNTFGLARNICLIEDYIYIADNTAGLVVLNLTENNSFINTTTVPLLADGHAYSFARYHNYLYMAARDEGIYIFDISDPSTPKIVDTFATTDQASFLFIQNQTLYISEGSFFAIYDISIPNEPSLLAEMKTTSPNQCLIVENDFAYIAAYSKGLRIIDVSNPTKPSLVSETSLGYSTQGIYKNGDYIYIGGQGENLNVLNIANKSTPEKIDSISLSNETGLSVHDIAKWKNFLFIACDTNGLNIVDITSPNKPVLVDSLNLGGSCQSLAVDNLKVYSANGELGVSLLNIFETSDSDSDGFMDGEDAFPLDPQEAFDADKDGTGDNADLDDDNDGYLDSDDEFPVDPKEWQDTDGDGVGDNADAFPSDRDEWEDTDNDGVGNNSDSDDDNDGLEDDIDEYPTDPFNIKRITFNGQGHRSPKLDGNLLVWRGYNDKSQVCIFMQDLTKLNEDPINIAQTIDSGFIGVPSISKEKVAWRLYDNVESFSIFLWEAGNLSNLTTYPAGNFTMPYGYPPSYHSIEVSLDNDQIAWAGWDGNDYEIFLWNGASIQQITDNELDDYEAQLNNGQISWTQTLDNGNFEIFFWDGSTISNISNRSKQPDEDSNLMNGKIAWSGFESITYLRDIYFYNGSETKVFNLPGNDYEPQIDNKDGFVTWHNRSNNIYNIYFSDGYEIFHLPTCENCNDIEPFANNSRIAFSRDVGNGYDIYIAEIRIDLDNDGVVNGADAFPLDPDESADSDGDNIGNNADDDDDNDGVLDINDDFPLDATR